MTAWRKNFAEHAATDFACKSAVPGPRGWRLPREEAMCKGRFTKGTRASTPLALPWAIASLDDDSEACTTHPRLPVTHGQGTRTTNPMCSLIADSTLTATCMRHVHRGERRPSDF